MEFSDLIWEIPNSLPDDFCDRLIEKFENDDRKYEGCSSGGMNKDIKDSVDLNFSGLPGWEEEDSIVYETVQNQAAEYFHFYSSSLWSDVGSPDAGFPMGDVGYQIQRTSADGKYIWHHDSISFPVINTIQKNNRSFGHGKMPTMLIQDRLFTFIYYLNDASEFEGGNTQFRWGEEIKNIVPERGKALWFPAEKSFPHRGQLVESGNKYIMTGWIHTEVWLNPSSTTTGSKSWREQCGEENMLFPMDIRPYDGFLNDEPVEELVEQQ